MKLDPRIKSVSDILTPFDAERAEQLIGQKGFFANSIDCFGTSDPYCVYGTLMRVFGHKDQTDPYLKMEGGDLYSFFIPESSLKPEEKKPEEKKYRPYTLMELITYIYIGSDPYIFDKPLNDYEWQEQYTEDFKPFGVEVEE